jgi:hypothetical protein
LPFVSGTKIKLWSAFIVTQSLSAGLFITELICDNKLRAAMKAGSDAAKIPKQALYPDLRFVNDCGKKNLLPSGKNTAYFRTV